MTTNHTVLTPDIMADLANLAPLADALERDAWLDLFDAAPANVREMLGLSSSRMSGMGLLASTTIPINELNRAMAVGVDRQPSERELDEAIAWLDGHAAVGWALQVADRVDGAETDALLTQRGLQVVGPGWAKFVQRLPAAASLVEGAALRTRPATAETGRSFGRLVQAGFGLPDVTVDWFAALVGRPGWQCFVASVNDQPAGGAAMFVAGNAAWGGMAATLPTFRGRGVQSTLIAARLEAAHRSGARLFTSETAYSATEDDTGLSSYRNQKRAGSTMLYVRPNWKRSA